MSDLKRCVHSIDCDDGYIYCDVMKWNRNDRPVVCNGIQTKCFAMGSDIYDVRDREEKKG